MMRTECVILVSDGAARQTVAALNGISEQIAQALDTQCVVTTGGSQDDASLVDIDGTLVAIRTVDERDPRHAMIIEKFGNGSTIGTPVLLSIAQLASSEDHQTNVRAAKAITILSDAFMDRSRETRGYWIVADRVFSADDANAAADEVRRGETPDSLWITPKFFRGRDSTPTRQTVGGYTRGLAALVGREIEMEPSGGDAQEVMMRLIGLTKWIIGEGLFMKDGDTIGTDEEAIRLTFDAHGGRIGGPIVRMRIETLSRLGG